MYNFIVKKNVNQQKLDNILNRYKFYFGDDTNYKIKFYSSFFSSFLTFGFGKSIKFMIGFNFPPIVNKILRVFNYLNVDFDFSSDEGWQWHLALSSTCLNKSEEVFHSKKVFFEWLQTVDKKNRVYLFGTGPSLAQAINLEWQDGYRIVCNTIVKDKELWHHINPHIIVAGDAIYHFAFNSFAQEFLKDLKQRLSESPNCIFIYPYLFHGFVSRELVSFQKQLVPIPFARDYDITRNLHKDFRLPGKIGNVLNLLLLPLGCFLSKNVFLYGFDGKKPEDKLFWKNSENHSYSEKIKDIIEAHPMFFKYHLPQNNPYKYIKEVHGDSLEKVLVKSEHKGWHFTMMHHSWTEVLQKRVTNNL